VGVEGSRATSVVVVVVAVVGNAAGEAGAVIDGQRERAAAQERLPDEKQ